MIATPNLGLVLCVLAAGVLRVTGQVDDTPPMLNAVVPASASAVGLDLSGIVLIFSEGMAVPTHVVYNPARVITFTNQATSATVTVRTSAAEVSGNSIVVPTPPSSSAFFVPGMTFTISVPLGAFADLGGNSFNGVTLTYTIAADATTTAGPTTATASTVTTSTTTTTTATPSPAPAPWSPPVSATRGFVGRHGSDVYIVPPENARVIVDGVDVHELKATHASLKAEHEADVVLLANAMCSAGVIELLSVEQVFDTVGAAGMEHFLVDGIDFIAVAHKRSAQNQHTVPSPIYRRAPGSNQFEVLQTVVTQGCNGWRHFEIDGVHFLVPSSSVTASTTTVVYRFSASSGTFTEYQRITTNGVTKWAHFAFDSSHYLAYSSANAPSVVFRWNPDTEYFDVHQRIETAVATDVEYFEIAGDHFLAFAQTDSDPSFLAKWNPDALQFELSQQLIKGPGREMNAHHFVIGNTHFLAMAAGGSSGTVHLPSPLYRWNATSKQLFLHQNLDNTVGASEVTSFQVGQNFFLAVSSYEDEVLKSYATTSKIFKWDVGQALFIEFESFDTSGALAVDSFTMGTDQYLAVSNHQTTATNFNVQSYLYKINPLCARFRE